MVSHGGIPNHRFDDGKKSAENAEDCHKRMDDFMEFRPDGRESKKTRHKGCNVKPLVIKSCASYISPDSEKCKMKEGDCKWKKTKRPPDFKALSLTQAFFIQPPKEYCKDDQYN